MPNKTKFTACKNCKFILKNENVERYPHKNQWNHYCKAGGKRKEFDFLNGKYIETDYPNCKLINKGLCTSFKPK